MYKQIIQGIKKNEENPTPSISGGVKINPEHGKKVAQAYHDMKHDPDHPEVKQAYEALIGETKQQFDDLMGKGLKISRIEPGMENPYKNSKELHADIKNNNHLWYFPTELGYGDNEQSMSHPMLQPTGVKHGDKELLANDLFRIVHDVNGHHAGGESGFGPTGEHKAYLTHKKMYSPVATKALASETLGQNSWVNFGPHGEHNRQNPSKTIYAEQKAGLLPDEIINGNWHTEEVKKSEKFYSEEEFVLLLKEFAIKKSYEYTKKYPNIPEEELNKNFGKLLRNGVALLGLVHAHHYISDPSIPQDMASPQAITRETSTLGNKLSESVKNWEKTPKSNRSKTAGLPEKPFFSVGSEEEDSGEEDYETPSSPNEKEDKINNFLKTTSMIESSGGKNLKHPKIKSGLHAGDRAIGQWALMPKTIKEIAGRMNDVPEIAAYSKMNSKNIEQSLNKNPHHEKAMVSFLANKLYDKFGGDENKMAFAWNQGHNINPESFETDRKNYLNHDYVKKYNKYKDMPSRNVAGSKDE